MVKSTPDERILRMELLDDARSIYEHMGITRQVGTLYKCGRYIPLKDCRMVIYDNGDIKWNGSFSCNSGSSCPRCSLKISKKQLDEISRGISSARKKGWGVYIATYNFRHSLADELTELQAAFGEARQRLYRNGSFRSFLASLGYKGRITDYEIRMLGDSGYHPHIHDMEFLEDGLDLDEIRGVYADYWLDALQSVGLSAKHDISVKVTGYQGVGDYITKMSSEMVLGNFKRDHESGSVSPFQLLKMFHDEPSEYLAAFWADYVTSVRHKRILGWSRGLRDALGVLPEEKTESNRIPVLTLDDYQDWEKLKPYEWQEIKELLQVGELEKVEIKLKSVRISYHFNKLGLKELKKHLD